MRENISSSLPRLNPIFHQGAFSHLHSATERTLASLTGCLYYSLVIETCRKFAYLAA
jgi:hypothetical protein